MPWEVSPCPLELFCHSLMQSSPPHFSVTALGWAPLNWGVKQLQKNLLGDIGVWHRPWGVWACWGPVAAAPVMSPGVWGGHWAGQGKAPGYKRFSLVLKYFTYLNFF